MFVGIVNNASAQLLTADGERGRSMRDAIGAAAWQLGLPLSLPEESLLRAEALDIEELSAVELPALNAIARSAGGDVALLGSLVWDETAGGWKADWRLDQNGIDYRWRTAGVSFDQAFRNAAEGAAMILSAAE